MPGLSVNRPKIGVIFRVFGRQGGGPFQQVDRLFMRAFHVTGHPKQMDSFRLVAVAREDLPAGCIAFGCLSCAELPLGQRESHVELRIAVLV